MADPGEGPRGPAPPHPPLFLDQTEARRAEKYLGGTASPPHLKVWIQHCLSMGKGDLESQKRPTVSKITCSI